jgi:hypothetical protein
MNMKNHLSLRKRGVPRSKPQLGHHYIRKPADASLLGTWLNVLHFIHDTNQKKTGKWTSPTITWINLHDEYNMKHLDVYHTDIGSTKSPLVYRQKNNK